MIKDENGFTLAEVMVAFAILLIVSQLLLYGIAFARKMEHRINKISSAADTLQEYMSDDSECISGTLRMRMDEDTELFSEGWLYQDENLKGYDLAIHAVRIEEGK